ncbi:hypothetical protein PCANC_05019 [Puccinia coronata f. sp. avenae]|uniref:Helitron helicase-like domain-containing protein n=1 Tax=Puccinia coronata f. sp. avenae TaxID=200324 RepID=A0A2N5T7R1_9BASI|nr:hypothetical protein PCANC_05019 [Puccinia coronata f. sp. avenae]
MPQTSRSTTRSQVEAVFRRRNLGNRPNRAPRGTPPVPPAPQRRCAPRTPITLESLLPEQRTASPNAAFNTESELIRKFGRELPSNIGNMVDPCSACGALHWKLEQTQNLMTSQTASYSTCCKKGDISMPVQYDNLEYPKFLEQLLSGQDERSANFQHRTRAYNNAVSFTSCGATLDQSVQGYRGIYSFRVIGALYHDLGSVFPDGESHSATGSFAQIYVTGGNDNIEASHRATQARSPIDKSILLQIQQYLSHHNSYARFFRSIEREEATGTTPEYHLRNYVRSDLDQNVYNAPRTLEVGVVIHNDSPDDIRPRDIVLQRIGGGLLHITDNFSGYLPLRYPLFFPHGEQGWIHATPISQCKWYAAMIFDRRNKFSPILNGKNLFQEFIVDVYLCVERSRLNFFRFNQAAIKADLYRGIQESFRNDQDPSGRRIILPLSFLGSPRNMLQLYQDAMASVRHLGKPLLFITMTANPRWPEIQQALKPHQTPSDCPDLVARVFRMKLASLIHDVVKNCCLGTVASYFYTIEFQKRGLPHAHIIIILEQGSVPTTVERFCPNHR